MQATVKCAAKSMVAAIILVSAAQASSARPVDSSQGNIKDRAASEEAAEKTAPEANITVRMTGRQTASTIHDDTGNEDRDDKSREDVVRVLGDTIAVWLDVVLSLCALAISFWAVRILRDTLRVTREAVSEAQVATRASISASTAASEANLILRAEQRPWLYVESVKVSQFRLDEGLGHDEVRPRALHLDLEVTFRNAGRLPAQNIMTTVEAFDIPGAEMAISSAADNNATGFPWRMGNIPPGGALSGGFFASRKFSISPVGDRDLFICILVVSAFYSPSSDDRSRSLVVSQGFSIDMVENGRRDVSVSAKRVRAKQIALVATPFGAGVMQ